MEARAIQRFVRITPRKCGQVLELIRGRTVEQAQSTLEFTPKYGARIVQKVLKSAVANAQQAAQRQNTPFDADTLRVSYAVVNEGQTLKRFTAAAMGRGTPILKRTSHVEIRVVGTGTPAAAPPAAKAATAAKAEAKPSKPRAKKPAAAKAKKKTPSKKKKASR